MKDKDRQNASNRKSLRFLLSLWQKKRMPLLVSGVLCVVALVFAAKWMIAQDARNYPKSGKIVKLDSEAAWTEFQQSAQNRLRAAEDQTATVREIMNELVNFARTYAGTEEAVFARLNHGTLAAALGDFETAEKSLQQAVKQTRDPQMAGAIHAQLAQLSIRPGGTPPEFNAYSLDGRKISPADYKGKVLLLDFWATWCFPCIAELPNVKQVYETYHDRGFEIVSISLDRNEETLRKFIKRQNLGWTHIHNASLPQGKDVATKYAVSAIPQMILVGRNGKIVEIGMRGPALEEAVERAINANEKTSRATGSHPSYAYLGQLAPALAVEEWVRGKATTLDALKGKVVLLDIFQIICPGCHAAHPEIVRMQKRYAGRGFEVLGVAVAFEYESIQTPRHIRNYVDRMAYPYPVAIDKGLIETFRGYRAHGTPYTVLIDRQGRIRYLDFFRLGRVESMVQQLLDEEAGR